MDDSVPDPASLVDGTARSIGELRVGPLGFGCWRFVPARVSEPRSLLEAALDHGMNLVDTADVYGLDWGGTEFGQAETHLGSVLGAAPGLRDRMVLASKGGIAPPTPYDSRRAWIERAVDDSLRRLRTDVLDLYQIHRPDFFTHPDELAETLTGLRESGKVREVGVSNYTTAQIESLAAALPFPLASTQPQYSVGHLHELRIGALDQAMRLGLAVLAWSPLMGGRLATGESIDGHPRPELIAELDRLAERESVDRAAVALAFVLAHPCRPVAIVGSQQPDRLAGFTASLSVQLDRADCYSLIEASEGVPLP